MDILNIDEILNSDCSSGFFDEDNQEDVINILQQWKKQGMRDTTPNKPDTRTFTRVKQKLFNNYYNKFDNEDEKKQNDFDFNKTIEYNNELYDHSNEQHISNITFLNDISPPVSSSFILDKGNHHQQQQLNRSLIDSDHFQNIDFLNSIDSDLNIERTFQLNSSAVSLSQSLSSSSSPPPPPPAASKINNHLYHQFDDNDKIKYHNDEIFNTLSMSGTKDFNIAQTDTDESQLNILSTNSSTTESTSDENINYQKSSSFINNDHHHHEHDPHHTFTKEESNLIKEKFLRSNKFFDNSYDLESTYNIENDDADLNMKINMNHSKLLDDETFINNKLLTPTAVFSDKTFKKKPKIQKTFQLHEHNIDNSVGIVDDMDDFENIEMVINELHLNNSKNNLNTSCKEANEHDEQIDFLLHSTPFQISNRKIKNSTEKWSNLISKHLNYDDDNIITTITDDDCMEKNINCIPNYNKRFESFTKDDIDKEIDCFEDIKINDNFKDYQDIIDDVEIDNDYDGKDFNTTSTIKMKQSLDNIKRKHFSQKQQSDKKLLNDHNNTSSNKKTFNCSPINSNRLLIRRSRLFEPNLEQNPETNLQQKNIKMSLENEMKQKTIFDNKQDILLGCNENENSSEHDDNNYCQAKNQNQLNTTVIYKTNKDLNIRQNNLKQAKNLEISSAEDNEKFVESIQEQQKHENDNQNVFKEPTAAAIKSIQSNNTCRILQRPKYVTRYLKQNSDNFYKANSAGDLSKTSNHTSDSLLDEKQSNHPMENNIGNKNRAGAGGAKISYKAKSFHNLAVGCSNAVSGTDTGTGTSADEINLLEPIRHEINKTAVEKSLIPNITCGDKITNNRSSVPFKSRLVRPTSGYYGSDVRNNPASLGFQQNLHFMNNAAHTAKKHSTNSSSSTTSTSSTISNISETNLTKNNVKKGIQQSTTVTIPTAAAATTTTNNNKSVLRVKRSGLPRPSSVIRR